MDRTHEWDRFVVEVWLRGEGQEPIDIQDMKLDLGYRTDLTSAVDVEFGRSFDGQGTFQLDDQAGQVRDIHATSSGVSLTDTDRVLFARIHFQAVPQFGDNVRMDFATGSVGPYSLELASENIAAMSADQQVTAVADTMPELGILPVIYDLNEDQKIGIADFAQFIKVYGETTESGTDGMKWFADFNKSYAVGLADFSHFIANYGKSYFDENITFPTNYPEAWIEPTGPGGGVVIGPGGGSGGGDGDPPPQPPVFNLNQFQVGIILPGANDVFEIMIGGINWGGIQIDRVTGGASLSDEEGAEEGEVVLTIVLEDEELFETEIELVFDGELIDTVEEFNEYSLLITAYVSEVMNSVKGMLSDALDDE
ncbi:hypothetical protein C5Y96_17020 [Blastopirellula marina]|uniref:EF-hand domain-containing protein n=2 Tax=Pirellulales TaxID=2691354 RepID=A0A2S8F7E4_9BACT|nr:hypothetical protein C5Y96_17020 [Blastopirellula marina]RCS48498.1 hypothetical protein DTL36_17040 [Bremerella cremea]